MIKLNMTFSDIGTIYFLVMMMYFSLVLFYIFLKLLKKAFYCYKKMINKSRELPNWMSLNWIFGMMQIFSALIVYLKENPHLMKFYKIMFMKILKWLLIKLLSILSFMMFSAEWGFSLNFLLCMEDFLFIGGSEVYMAIPEGPVTYPEKKWIGPGPNLPPIPEEPEESGGASGGLSLPKPLTDRAPMVPLGAEGGSPNIQEKNNTPQLKLSPKVSGLISSSTFMTSSDSFSDLAPIFSKDFIIDEVLSFSEFKKYFL